MKSQNEEKEWSLGWYCVRAKPKMEIIAATTLNTLDSVEVFLPKTIRPKKLKEASAKPLFPGYFFARFDPVINIRNVHFARGVSYVVRRMEVPVIVPPEVMVEFRMLSPNGVLEIPDQPHKIGQKVSAIAGLFKGDEGKVVQLIPSRERIKVLFEILGRSTEVEIDENFLDFPSVHPISAE